MAQSKTWNDVAFANAKALTQHDTMGDWQEFRSGSKNQRKIAAEAGLLGPKMPKMGDRFLHRPSDSEIALALKGKRARPQASNFTTATVETHASSVDALEASSGGSTTSSALHAKTERSSAIAGLARSQGTTKKRKVESASSSDSSSISSSLSY